MNNGDFNGNGNGNVNTGDYNGNANGNENTGTCCKQTYIGWKLGRAVSLMAQML